MKPIHLYVCTAFIVSAITAVGLARFRLSETRAPVAETKTLADYFDPAMTELPAERAVVSLIELDVRAKVPTPETVAVSVTQFSPSKAYAGRRVFAVTVDCENIYGTHVSSEWVYVASRETPYARSELVQVSGADPWCGTKAPAR